MNVQIVTVDVVRRISMVESKVGMKVILLRAMLGNEIGAVGFVYEEYVDFDDKSKTGLSIIFQNGKFDGFSFDDQKRYLQFLGIDPRYSLYSFRNVNHVMKYFKSGYWKFHE